VSLKLLHDSNKQFITNLYQCNACGWSFPDTIIPFNNTNMLVAACQRLWSGVSSAIRFLFLALTCVMVENVLSHPYVLPDAERVFVRNLSVWETYVCW